MYNHTDGNDYWLEWDGDYIKVVEGPIPGDSLGRLYWTGETYPKMSVASSIKNNSTGPWPGVDFKLGIPAGGSISASISGTQDADVSPEDASWVYTFVSIFGEEGPPSAATTAVTFTPSTQTATVSIPNYTGSGYGTAFGTDAKKRLYRSNTGSTNTQFQFVKEVVLNQVIQLIDVVIVVEMEKLDPTKDFLQSNKHVLNVQEVGKK